ncbi:undecaprenyl-phosphate galactose phosphotransferase WbaP [Acidobacteriota bacterium]
MKNKIISFMILLMTDVLVIFISYTLAYILRVALLPNLIQLYEEIPLQPFSTFLKHYYMAAIWVLVFAYEKLYEKRYSFWEEVKALTKSSTLSSFLVIISIFMTKTESQFSRTVVVLAWILSLALFPMMRAVVKIIMTGLNIWKKKLLILGVHQTSLSIVDNIRKNRTLGYEVMAFIDDDPAKIGKTYRGIKVFGPISELENIAKSYGSKDIMVVTPHLPRKSIKKILTMCENVSESMWLIPRSGDFITEGVNIEVIGDILSLYIKRNLTKPWNVLIKTVSDIFFTLFILFFSWPLLALIALAIGLESKGPAIYVQKRVGRSRRPFEMYKFRSMYLDNEQILKNYLQAHPEADADWKTYKKLKNRDPRVTRVGRFIRKFSLDELPQLFNILKGEMSLVGPRPYIPEELVSREDTSKTIARVKPGLTGLWQVSGRSDVGFEDRLAIDEYYIRNWSLWMDITILLRSFMAAFSSRGAY